jgi:hypothetical protein
MGTDTLETIKLVFEVVAVIGSILGSLWAMITRPLRKEIKDLLTSAKAQFREIRDEMKSERAETKEALGELMTGQQALALAQNGDHLLLGRLEAGQANLEERANKALDAQRKDIDHTHGQVEDLRRDVDGIRRDVEYLKGRVERG